MEADLAVGFPCAGVTIIQSGMDFGVAIALGNYAVNQRYKNTIGPVSTDAFCLFLKAAARLFSGIIHIQMSYTGEQMRIVLDT